MSFLRFISNFRDFGPQAKNIFFAIFDFPNLQYARKLNSFRTKMRQSINWKDIEKQYSSGHFLHKAEIKREIGI